MKFFYDYYAVHAINVKLLLCFGYALFITVVLIPAIVEIAKAKGLYDVPDNRKSHSKNIPTLGGLAIFTGFAFSSLLFFNGTAFPKFQFLVAGLLIIFYTGFKDDIIGISPFKKFMAQVIAALIITVMGGIRLSNLHGFIGIDGINPHVGLLVTVVTIVGITNCFNLLDGIDGLSASIGLLVSGTFGVWFYLIAEYDWAMLSTGLVGSFLGFFFFNVFGKKNKIFMGDTGSLILGFIISILAIKFNEFNVNLNSIYHIRAAPSVSIGIIMIPLFDTLRVFVTRIFKGRPPFMPDRTHIHHYLLDLGLSHFSSTAVLFITNIFFIIVAFALRNLTVAWLLLVLLLMAGALSYLTIFLAERKKLHSRTQGS